MKTYRRTAVAVGILFILATATSLLGTALIGSLSAGQLAQLAGRQDRLITAALLELAAGISVLLIPALLFPVLKRYNEGLALGYFGLRLFEATTMMLSAVSVLLLVTLGRQSVAAGTALDPSLRAAAALALGLHDWAFPLDPVVFGLGAVLFYSLLYSARLVPRWLSVWGLVAAVVVFALGLLRMYGGGTLALAVPIAVQEMVLAAWLIVRGFDTQAVADEGTTRSAKVTSHDLRGAPVLESTGTQP